LGSSASEEIWQAEAAVSKQKTALWDTRLNAELEELGVGHPKYLPFSQVSLLVPLMVFSL
jgi:hypothetical protein